MVLRELISGSVLNLVDWGPYGVPRIGPGEAMCNASALPTVLSLLTLSLYS